MHRKIWLNLLETSLLLSLLTSAAPASSAEPQISSTTLIYESYQVRKGDTLESVAKRFGIEVTDLKEANKFLETESLKPNQSITIPLHRANPPSAGEDPQIVSVQAVIPGRGSPKSDSSSFNQMQVAARTSPPSQARPTGTPAVSPSKGGPSVGASPSGRRVGVLGVVRRSGAPIRSSPRAGGSVVYSCSKGTQLVIVGQKGAWYGVMMIDGSICWIEKAAVDLTDVELVQSTPPPSLGGRWDIVQAALAWLGTPYRYGGTTIQGIDCSALVMNVYRQFGVRLPRTAREQYRIGQPVSWDQLLPGDRLYFSSDGRTIDHTGLYMGEGQFVHASGRRGMVGIDTLADPSYWRMFVGAKR